jgi:energy-coupling factor transporter ATP-binding protein EcfA2
MRRVTTTLIILGVGALVLWEALAQGTRVWTKYKLLKEPLPSVTTLIPSSTIQPLIALTLITILLFTAISAVMKSRKLFGLIPVKDLVRHVVILGPTGSGKTTVAKTVLEKVLRSGSVEQVIIIDWKGEYSQWVKGATIVRKLRNVWGVPGDSPREKALMATELIREMGRDVIDITPPSSLLLLKILEEEYRRRVPTTEKVIDILERNAMVAQREGRHAESNMYLALARRLYLLLVDEERKDENTTTGDPMITIYDLSLPSVHLKVLYSNFVLASVYREAMKMHRKSDDLRTLVIAEEAQNYVRPRRNEELPSLAERIIYELRAFGVGVVLVCPDPELLPSPILKDVGTIIATSPDSLPRFALERFLFRASLEEAEKTLKALKKAKVIIYHKGALHFLRRFPKLPKPKGPKGDRMGVTDPGVGSLRAWPILPHRSPGRPTVVEVKEEVTEGPKVVEVEEMKVEEKPKVVEVKTEHVEELKLEEELEEEEEGAGMTEVIEKPAKEEKFATVEKEVTEEQAVEPEPAPKGPPIPSSLPYRGSLCPAGRTATSGRAL